MSKGIDRYRCVLSNRTVGFIAEHNARDTDRSDTNKRENNKAVFSKKMSACGIVFLMLCSVVSPGSSWAAQDTSVAYDLFDDGRRAKTSTPATDATMRAHSDGGMVTAEDVRQQLDVEGVQYMAPVEIVGEGQKYTLGPDDVVQITVRNQPDFSGYFIIGPEGHIQYNWCGDVLAEGLSKNELKELLIEKLKKYVRYPEVSVQIMEYNSKAVYVVGTVAKPGKYPMKGDHIKLRDALVAAGLPTDVSALGRARIIRETVDGPQSIEVDLDDLLYQGKMDLNYELEPGDIVYIPMSRFVKTTQIMSQVLGPAFQAASVYSLGNDLMGGDDD